MSVTVTAVSLIGYDITDVADPLVEADLELSDYDTPELRRLGVAVPVQRTDATSDLVSDGENLNAALRSLKLPTRESEPPSRILGLQVS